MYRGRENAYIHAKCPYFIRDSKNSITCEGFTDRTELKTIFESESQKDDFLRDNCKCLISDCPVRAGLDMKYRELG